MKEYGLPLYDASLLTSTKAMADYYEEATRTESYQKLPQDKAAKEVSNWLLGEVSRIMKTSNIDIGEFSQKVRPERLVDVSVLTSQAVINTSAAKITLEDMFKTGKSAEEIIKERGLSQISDTGELEATIADVINSNTQAVSDYRAGKEAALKFLVGQVMRATKGRANPALAGELLQRKLEEG
jgi:aspartyl-tRNA(Asn)/glutamyl-tRNA(Gln) amidotransferase subunit B